MKKIIFVLIGLVIAIPLLVSAQTSSSSSVDYGSLGSNWMQNMMGSRYSDFQNDMVKIMGSDNFQKMQEIMGQYYNQRLQDNGYEPSDYGHGGFWNMMGGTGMMGNWNGGYSNGWSFLGGFGAVLMAILAFVLFLIPIGVLALIILLIVKLVKSVGK